MSYLFGIVLLLFAIWVFMVMSALFAWSVWETLDLLDRAKARFFPPDE